MPLTLEALEAEALKLSETERARLVDRLITSLDTDPEVEKAWAAEVEGRQMEIENGTVKTVSGADAVARL